MKWSRYLHTVTDGSSTAFFNALTGAFARLPDEAVRSLARIERGGAFDGSRCSPSLYAGLVHGGFLIQPWDDEYLRWRLSHDAVRNDPTTAAFTVVPTLACNLRCRYCFEDKTPLSMAIPVQDAVISSVERLALQGVVKRILITWYGGEPLLALDAVVRMAEAVHSLCKAHKVGYHSTMITNGTQLTAEVVRQLVSLGCRTFQVTIDGLGPVHNERKPLIGSGDSFELITSNLKSLGETDASVMIRMNVDRQNVGQVEPLIEYLLSEGVLDPKNSRRRFSMAPVQYWRQGSCLSYPSSCFIPDDEFAMLELETNERLYRRFGFEIISLPTPRSVACGAVSPYSYVIGPSGETYRCWTDVGIPEWVTGHLSVTSDTELNFQYLTQSPAGSAECRDCAHLPICAGGCPGKSFHGIQTIEGHYCSRERHRLDALVKQFLQHRLQEVASSA